jgi:dTDP-4-dehydrorhamnose 3,5-epimerase
MVLKCYLSREDSLAWQAYVTEDVMFKVDSTRIADVKIITSDLLQDDRGFFSEVYSRNTFAEAVFNCEFVQDNHSLSKRAGTVRGLHFQSYPFAQHKLIRAVHGRILDVAVDLRRSSPTYGQHVAVELSSKDMRQLFVPIGFAHGLCTLEPDTEVIYKVSNYYSREHDFGLAWDDPALAIAWPVAPEQAALSDKDRRHPRLADLQAYFD